MEGKEQDVKIYRLSSQGGKHKVGCTNLFKDNSCFYFISYIFLEICISKSRDTTYYSFIKALSFLPDDSMGSQFVVRVTTEVALFDTLCDLKR